MGNSDFIHSPRASLAELIFHRFPLGYRMRGRGVSPENELTDRTFFTDGTKTRVVYHVPRLLYLARWKIAAGRWAPIVLAGIAAAGYWQVSALLAVAGVLFLIRRAVVRSQQKWHGRHYVEPLAERIHELVGVSPDVPAADWLSLPRDFATNPHGGQIVLTLPGKFHTGDEKLVDRLLITVAQVLGVAREDLAVRQKFAGKTPQLLIKIKPPPPREVLWGKVQGIIAGLGPAEVLLGLGRGGHPVTADLDHDSPHLLVTSGSGGGKTTLIRSVICQLVMRGAVGLIFDPKVTSHRWAKGLANVALLIKSETMFHALLAVQAEVHRRNDVAFNSPLEDEQPDTGRRIVIGLEEMNTLTNMLKRYWQTICKLPEWQDYATNPALDALSDIIQMGRFVRVHVVLVGQRASVDALGGGTKGGDIRESFFFRVLLQSTAQTWRMLVPGLKTADIPSSSKRRGRGHLAYGSQHELFQGVNLSEVDAMNAAQSGAITKWRDVVALDNLAFQSGTVPAGIAGNWDIGASGASGAPDGNSRQFGPRAVVNIAHAIAAGEYDVPEVEPPVTLREASSDKGRAIVPNTYESLLSHRKRGRNKGFPLPTGVMRGKADTFDPAELRFFVRNLERSGDYLDGPGADHGLTGWAGGVGEPAGDGVIPDGQAAVGHTRTQ